MERGTYVAASGGLFQLRKLEIVNNNLANINTPGFKREVLVGDVETFDQTLASLTAKNDPFAKGDQERTPGTVNVRALTDFTQGPIEGTGNPFDVALKKPNDFFVISTPEGFEYTRAGNFTLGINGQLSTKDGAAVSGDGGSAITLNGVDVAIQPNGTITQRGVPVARLQVARFEDPSQLERVGNSRFKLPNGVAAPESVEPEVIPNSLERSNVSAITGVVDLMSTQRAFQMYTKSTETIDSMNQAAISQIGRR